MKLEMRRGCIWDSLTVDNVEEIDLTDEVRKEVLFEISKFIATLDIRQFGKLMANELAMYENSEELEYATDFYLSLIDKEIIQPFEQYPKEWNHYSELLSRQLRCYVSKYVRDLSPNYLNYVMQDLLPTLGRYENCGYCECCGDVREIYYLEL